MIVLALVLAVSVGVLLKRMAEYRQGEETYTEAKQLVDLPDFSALPPPAVPVEREEVPETPAAPDKPVYVDPYTDALRDMNFTALREVNPDVVGWILIPGTAISYPLVQGKDNQYYLNRTWKKWSSVVGSIFLEHTNSRDLSDFNTIIYGHRMNNGSMFAALKNYKKQSYWAKHPAVYITDDNGAYRYEIFAAYEVSTTGEAYRLGLTGDVGKQAFLDDCTARSVIQTGVTPTVYDKVLTLSTCTGSGHATRWVVQARLQGVAPPDSAEEPPSGAEAPPLESPAPPVS